MAHEAEIGPPRIGRHGVHHVTNEQDPQEGHEQKAGRQSEHAAMDQMNIYSLSRGMEQGNLGTGSRQRGTREDGNRVPPASISKGTRLLLGAG